MRTLPISLLTLALATAPALGQSAPATAQRADLAAFQRQALPPDANDDTRALTALQYKFEDATIRGDVAFVDSVEDPTMTMVHGDHWTTGGLAQLADDKASYDKRVADQYYYVHDLDPTSLRYELHHDIAICYGRYLSVVGKQPNSKTPGRITSIWFMRVFKKRPDGQWVYLSHRTVHGPINTPAGIDPTRVPFDSTPAEQAKIPVNPPGASALGGTPTGARAGVGATAGARPAGAMGVPADKDPTVSKSPEAAEVVAFQNSIEDALVKGDVAFVKTAVADDFSMVHGDIWIRGGPAEHVDTKADYLKYAADKHYTVRDDDHVRVEMHGDVAVAYGRYVGFVPSKAKTTPSQGWFSAWYERVYEKQNGHWTFVSHRTVFGPTYGPTREAIGDK